MNGRRGPLGDQARRADAVIVVAQEADVDPEGLHQLAENLLRNLR